MLDSPALLSTPLPETTWAWVAGLIDGEGSIMLTNHPTPRPNISRTRPIVSISNCDLRLMEALQERTGCGRIYKHRRQPKENQKRDAYTWRLTALEQREVLPHVLPWLVSKREQAELLLRALEVKDQLTCSKGKPAANFRERDVLRAERDSIQQRISALNRRGRLAAEEVMPA